MYTNSETPFYSSVLDYQEDNNIMHINGRRILRGVMHNSYTMASSKMHQNLVQISDESNRLFLKRKKFAVFLAQRIEFPP